ncbi:RCC1 domain-containing protein [Lujinxingia vulgaris]|uniref:RCC1 domain-containing protein n=1 Tax=Lujinxingia vulgaris TaxID=2600176 RepID=UPI001E454CCA|nr:hypothetical protein [Lujinxingia vulgaris]
MDTSPLCDDSEPDCENGVWIIVDAGDVGDVDSDTDADVNPDVEPDTDTDLPPDLSLELTGGEESPYVIDEATGVVSFDAACAPDGCTLDACTLSFEGGEAVALESCTETIELTTAELNAEGSWTLTVNATLDEQNESTSTTFDVRYAFDAGIEGLAIGEHTFSHPPELESFCTREDCELTIACTDAEGGELACEDLAFPEGEASVNISLIACAAGLEPEHCLGEQTYNFAFVPPTWTQVATGAAHSCGMLDDGTLWCWGNNGSGRLGDGFSTQRDQPTRVAGDGVWIHVSAGGQHTCGIKEGGSLWCWGDNAAGQVIPGSGSDSSYPTPQDVSEGLTWTQVATGTAHTCAITSDEALYCWGRDETSQLGTGTATNGRVRVRIDGSIERFVAVAAGDAHTCAVTADDANAWCWGSAGEGRLNGDPDAGSGPVKVQGVPGLSSSVTTMVATGGAHSCAIVIGSSADQLFCWGSDSFGQVGHNISPTVMTVVGLSDAEMVSAGKDHTCAVAAGAAYCWGNNAYGQLGRSGGNEPAQVSEPATGWLDIAAGGEHSCGIADGMMRCWGLNTVGQLGHTGSGSNPTPIAWPYTP